MKISNFVISYSYNSEVLSVGEGLLCSSHGKDERYCFLREALWQHIKVMRYIQYQLYLVQVH